MTTETLKRLIAGGEALNVEFKGEQRSALNDSDLVEAVVCLANCTGTETSWLLIGVEDDGSVTGACPRHGNATEPHKVAALIGVSNCARGSCTIAAVPSEAPQRSSASKITICDLRPERTPRVSAHRRGTPAFAVTICDRKKGWARRPRVRRWSITVGGRQIRCLWSQTVTLESTGGRHA